MEELVKVFLEESREILQQLEADLLEMEQRPDDRELIKSIFRAAHTIKGSAGLTGLDCISKLAHKMEDVLDQVRSTGKPMSRECFDTVFKSMDMLNKMVDMTAVGEEIPLDLACDLMERLSCFVVKENPRTVQVDKFNSSVDKKIFKIILNFKADIFESGHDPVRFLKEIQDYGQVLSSNVNFSGLPGIEEINPYTLYIAWVVFLETTHNHDEIEEIFAFVIDDNKISIFDVTDEYESPDEIANKLTGELLVEEGFINEHQLGETLKKQKRIGEILTEEAVIAPGQVEKVIDKQRRARELEQVNTIRVDINRLENVLNMAAELVISQSRVKELVSNLNQVDVEVFNAFETVDKIIRQLQEEVMKTSMVPIGATFTRFQRMIRDLATEKGKVIQLLIHGQETELDKRVIEQIADPLKHMLRNSIDHGIETPEQRESVGKPRVGTIWLNAYHQEGSIIIEISDDGKGLDPDKIHRKAVEKGLVDENFKLGHAEMLKLIMMPGFSTAEAVTDISGRGVGLDVVATNIQSLRGSVEVESQLGKGTKFVIKLPLTLAIIDGMMVTVGDQKFIIPLTAIVEFIKADARDVRTVEGAGRVVHIRNEYIPLASLYKLLNISTEKIEATQGLLVIIKDARKKIALLVDDILGQEQVVTKSLKENYRQVEGIAGATILGDGNVALILDIPTLIQMASGK